MASDGEGDSILEVARRHVLTGRQIVANQRLRIEYLKAKGLSTSDAETTLALFERSQEIFEDHLRELEAEG
jgi:hypothetical protein